MLNTNSKSPAQQIILKRMRKSGNYTIKPLELDNSMVQGSESNLTSEELREAEARSMITTEGAKKLSRSAKDKEIEATYRGTRSLRTKAQQKSIQESSSETKG